MLRYAYPPEARGSGRDYFGRPLPPLPSKTPKGPRFQYAINKSFSLKTPNQVVTVTVVKHLDVAFSNFSQAVLANIEDGLSDLAGKQVFLKFYDPLFLNPDDLQSIRMSATRQIGPEEENSSENIPSPPRPSSSSSSSSGISLSVQTLFNSIEASKKDVTKLEGCLKVKSYCTRLS